jgi:hypothetical protein
MVELLLLLLLWLLLLKLPRLELWVIAPIPLLLWSTQLTSRWGIHHTVHGRSTARATTARILLALRNCQFHVLTCQVNV